MGYYVTLNETNAYIPETDLHDAYISANSNLYVQLDTSLNGQLYVEDKLTANSDKIGRAHV